MNCIAMACILGVGSVLALASVEAWSHSDEIVSDRPDIRHAGVDLVAAPGGQVVAPVDGVVTRIGRVYEGVPDYHFVEIAPQDGLRTRVYYIHPTVKAGQKVAGGLTPIGTAEDLQRRYPGITDHVHLEIRNPAVIANPSAPIKYGRYEAINPTPLLQRYQKSQ